MKTILSLLALALLALPARAQRVTDLPPGNAIGDTDLFLDVQGYTGSGTGTTTKISGTQLGNYVLTLAQPASATLTTLAGANPFIAGSNISFGGTWPVLTISASVPSGTTTLIATGAATGTATGMGTLTLSLAGGTGTFTGVFDANTIYYHNNNFLTDGSSNLWYSNGFMLASSGSPALLNYPDGNPLADGYGGLYSSLTPGSILASAGTGTATTAATFARMQAALGSGTLSNSTTGNAATATTAGSVGSGTYVPFLTAGVPSAATSSEIQLAIGSGVYDISGAAATAQSNAEAFASNAITTGTASNITGTITAGQVAANNTLANTSGTLGVNLASANVWTATATFPQINVSSGVTQFSLNDPYAFGGPAYPVPSFRPTTGSLTFAVDLMPNGTPADIGYGTSWLDVCGSDINGDVIADTPGLHLGCSTTHAYLGSLGFGGATPVPLLIEMGAAPGTIYGHIETNGRLTWNAQSSNVYDNGGELDIIKTGSYTSESGGLTISTAVSNGIELIEGCDSGNSLAWIQSASRGTNFTAYPLAVQPNGGRLLIGGKTDDGSTLLQVDGNAKVTGTLTANGSVNANAAQTNATATTGTITFAEPFAGTSYKRIQFYANAATGTFTYVFPTAFTNAPSTDQILLPSGLTVGAIGTGTLSLIGTAVTGGGNADGF